MTKEETWRNSKGKKLLLAEIKAGTVKKGDNPDVVHKTNAEYEKWPLKNFRANMKSLINATTKASSEAAITSTSTSTKTKNKKKDEKWGTSEAKRLLRDSIIAGHVKRGDDAAEVHKSNAEYQKWPIANFKTNMKNLIEAIALDYKRMADDCRGYGHDIEVLREYRKNNPTSQPYATPWHKSTAKKLLEADMDSNKHLKTLPMELYQSRIEYREFSLRVFRDHIYQEKKKRANKGTRYAKKKKRLPPPPRDIATNVGEDLIADWDE
jgi:hypothetical protein